MNLKELVMVAFQISMLLIVFGFGLRATLGDVSYLLRNPWQLARSLVAMFVVMPIVMIALVRVFELPLTLEICLVALAFSPVPPLAPKKLTGAGGQDQYAYALMATFSLLAIVIVPLAVKLAGLYYGRPFSISSGAISGIVTASMVVPLVAGMLVRRVFPALAARLEPPVSAVGGVLLAVAALVLVGGTWPALWGLVGNGTLAAIVAFVVTGLLAGHLIGGPGLDQRTVLALACAGRHPMIALTIATANYPEGHFGGTILLYLVVNAIVCIPYVKWARAHIAPPHAAGAQNR